MGIGREKLIEKFFHTFHMDNDILALQGQIVNYLGDGYYLAQIFSWFSGDPLAQKIVHISDMTGWQFYQDRDAMVAYYGRHKRQE